MQNLLKFARSDWWPTLRYASLVWLALVLGYVIQYGVDELVRFLLWCLPAFLATIAIVLAVRLLWFSAMYHRHGDFETSYNQFRYPQRR